MSSKRVIREKLARLRGGERMRVLDLFSGCGGLTLGCVQAGCESLGGIEIDPVAARSHILNFHPGRAEEDHDVAPAFDLAGAGFSDLSDHLGFCEADLRMAVDLLVAGPPCPSFSRIGRSKLAHVNGRRNGDGAVIPDPEAYLKDERTHLYMEAVRVAEAARPVAVLVENVPEFVRHGGCNHGEILAVELERLGYECRYTILNAASYGVPQWRDRFFLLGVHREAETIPAFPPATHSLRGMPSGYKGRRTHLGLMDGLFGVPEHWVPAPRTSRPGLPDPVSSREALMDLPKLVFKLRKGLVQPRVVVEPEWDQSSGFRYREDLGPSSYARLMRDGGCVDPFDHMHETRLLSMSTGRDQRIFKRLEPGSEYPAAIQIAESLFHRAIERRTGGGRSLSEEEEERLRRMYVPPYAVEKFRNKWWKLVPDLPSRTLTAHLGKDTYSHIHYDSEQARPITVREAARLQSFPDSFRLAGSMNARFRQIGNAVPPLLAEAVVRHLMNTLIRSPGSSARTRKNRPEQASSHSGDRMTGGRGLRVVRADGRPPA